MILSYSYHFLFQFLGVELIGSILFYVTNTKYLHTTCLSNGPIAYISYPMVQYCYISYPNKTVLNLQISLNIFDQVKVLLGNLIIQYRPHKFSPKIKWISTQFNGMEMTTNHLCLVRSSMVQKNIFNLCFVELHNFGLDDGRSILYVWIRYV